MARPPIVDISELDVNAALEADAELDQYLAQQGQMRHLDALLLYEHETHAVGVKRVRDDEFWCEGHFPGWPVLPGVIMLEAMGQLSTILWRKTFNPEDRVMMFGGLDDVRFRGAVTPGDNLIVICKPKVLRMKMSRFECQTIVNGKVTCDALVSGVLGPKLSEAKAALERGEG